MTQTVHGGTLYWDANAATAGQADGAGAWLNASQWWNGTTNVDWTSGDNAIFGNGGAGGAVTLASPTTVGSLTLNYFTSTYTIGTAGNAITINSGITKNAGPGTLALAGPLVLGAAQIWTNNSTTGFQASGAATLDNGGFNLTFDGAGSFNLAPSGGNTLLISGGGGIIKNGTGDLNFDSNPTVAHNFTGDIVVNGGSIGFQTGSIFNGKNTKLNGGYLGGRFNSDVTWSNDLGTGANQIQITGGVSGFSGESNSDSVFTIGTALSTLKWGASVENGATGFFNPTAFFLNGSSRMNANGTGLLNNGIDLNGSNRTFASNHTNWDGASATGGVIGGAIVNTAGTAAGIIRTGIGNLSLIAANTYDGATTINGGTLTLRSSGTANNSNALNLGGGILRLVNTAQVNRFADGAAITVTAGGGITYENTNTAAITYTETLGALTLNGGNLNIVQTTNQSTSNGQTLTFGNAGTSNLTQSGTASVTFSAATTGPQASGNKNMISVFGAGSTAANEILGAWATTGTTAALQTDYAVYSSDYVVPAAIAASDQSTWTTAANAYTTGLTGLAGTTLGATRNITALKATTAATALTSVTFAGTAATDFITVTGNTFANGDVVTFGGTAPGGLNGAIPYYVINVGTNGVGTFTVSATSGGAPIDLTGAGTTPNVLSGITLGSGINLGITGILNSGAGGVSIGKGTGGVLTLPSTTSANLYVNTGNAAFNVGAPIADNGAGVLTLVKTGSSVLRLLDVNTFTGNIAINAGTLQIGINGVTTGAKLGGAGGSYAGNIFIGAGANLDFQTNADQTLSGVISGDGNLLKRYIGTLTLSGANTYTGKTTIGAITNAGDMTLVVSSFNSVNGGIPLLASSSLGAPTTMANGTIEMGSNNSSPNPTLRYTGAAATGETTDRVINFIFNSGATRTLDASNPSGLLNFTSAFTSNGTATGSLVLTGSGNAEIAQGLPFAFTNFTKSGNGTWTLGGSIGNTGATTVSAGTLIINGNHGSATGAFAVNGTSTLGGAGTISGTVTVAGGANLAPGATASAGTLTLKSGLNITAPASGGAGKLRFDLGAVAASDKLVVGGALTIGTGVLGFSDFVFTPRTGLANGTYPLITSGSITLGNELDSADLTGNIGAGFGELRITGSTIELVVTGLGGLSGYSLWASTNATSTTPEQDQDGDGVSNAVEYLLGGSHLTNDQTKLPTFSLSGGDLVFTFQRAQVSIDGTTTPVIEVGTDLVNWPSPSPYAIPSGATVNNPGVTVVKDSSPGFDTITLTLPRGLEPKVFARIKVAVTP